MRKPLLFAALPIILAAALAGFAPPAAAQTGEAIDTFVADVTIRADGRIDVIERIEYAFPAPRHGIYRDLPFAYQDDQGKRHYAPVTVLSVTDAAGRGWPYQVEWGTAGLRIKIGDASRTVSGRQTYVIAYRVEGALGYFSDHDELYWNVTGEGWSVPISRVSAVVHLPDAVQPADIRIKCFTGAYGSTDENCLGKIQGHRADFSADVGPLTVVVGWPTGLVAQLAPPPPSPWLAFWPFSIPLMTFLFLLWRWYCRGRDAAGRGPLVVQYEPPNKLTPAEMGTLLDERAGVQEVTATIVDLAVRGYLKIREVEKPGLLFSSKDYEFDKLKDFSSDATLQPFERKILSNLFGLLPTVPLSYVKENHVFFGALEGIYRDMYLATIQRGYFVENPNRARLKAIGLGTAFVVAISLVAWLIVSVLPNASVATGRPLFPIAVILSIIVVAVFSRFMAAKTSAGVAVHEQVMGFRDYLNTAEKYRLEWQEKEKIFERFLPYAMIFGIAEKWVRAFEGLDLQPPQWYQGSAVSQGVFNAAVFGQAMNSLGSSMNSAVLSSPQQSSGGSGFGGGGFSGGGSGGGGGGSW